MGDLIDRILTSKTGTYSRLYASNVSDMLVADLRNNEAAFADARARLADVARETLGVAEVYGARQVLDAAGAVLRHSPRQAQALRFADNPSQTILHSVTFEQALADMVERAPRTLVLEAERTAARIAALYSEGQNIAFVHSAEEAVTKKVQSLIAQALRTGQSESKAVTAIIKGVEDLRTITDPWARSYAQMAFRTNVNTAVTAGRFKQAREPGVMEVTPAFQFRTAGDSNVRDSHKPFQGLIFRVDNPIWNEIAPPIFYNCRCKVRLMSVPQLLRKGRYRDGEVIESPGLPAGAVIDRSFRRGARPDLGVPAA